MKLFLPILFLFLLSPVLAEEVVVDRFCFDSPFSDTKFEKLGGGGFSATWPADKPYKEAALEMIVASYDADAVKAISEGDGSLYRAALSTFTGIYGEPKSINKTLFFGTTSAHQIYDSKVPRKHESHVYSKALKDGSFVLVAVRVFQPRELKYGQLLRSIANTFKVKE